MKCDEMDRSNSDRSISRVCVTLSDIKHECKKFNLLHTLIQ